MATLEQRFGVLGYVVAMAAEGKVRAVPPLMWGLVVLFVVFFLSDWLTSVL